MTLLGGRISETFIFFSLYCVVLFYFSPQQTCIIYILTTENLLSPWKWKNPFIIFISFMYCTSSTEVLFEKKRIQQSTALDNRASLLNAPKHMTFQKNRLMSPVCQQISGCEWITAKCAVVITLWCIRRSNYNAAHLKFYNIFNLEKN